MLNPVLARVEDFLGAEPDGDCRDEKLNGRAERVHSVGIFVGDEKLLGVKPNSEGGAKKLSTLEVEKEQSCEVVTFSQQSPNNEENLSYYM